MLLSPLVEAALNFAAQAHSDQVRKGTTLPYIVHPVGVMLTLQAAGETDPELLAAALLHDTVEDSGVTPATLQELFGPRVAEIVVGASEPFARDDPWEERKQHTVAYLRTAPRAVQLVAAADKLHNLHSMEADFAAQGELLWTRFKRGRTELAWYYRAITESLQAGGLADHPLVRDLAATLDSFFGPAASA
jgi:(p)ppGpp synthase/HD superfamily hydrolase